MRVSTWRSGCGPVPPPRLRSNPPPLDFLPPDRMPRYRIKYHVWAIEAASASEAKQKVFDLLKTQGSSFISVEEASTYNPNRSLLKRLITGR